MAAGCEEQLPELKGASGHLDACIRSDVLDLTHLVEAAASWEGASDDADVPPALSARGLTVTAGRRRVLSKAQAVQILYGVDLTIRRGEAVALVGESGSGKTTLLRAVAGLMEPGGDGETTSGTGHDRRWST